MIVWFVWPLVIVVGLVAPVSWRAMSVVVLIYAALFFVSMTWLTQGTGITLPMVALNWWNMNGIGTLLVLAFLARPIKAVGPIVVALMMAPTAGVFGMAHLLTHQRPLEWVVLIATKLGFSGHVGGIAAGLIVFVLAAVATGLVGYIGLRGIGRLYKAQWISDQSLQVDAVWLVFAVAQVPGEPLAGLAAFVIYELVVRLGLHVFCPGNRADSRPPRLLLLRVFSLGRRSESLFGTFSLLWRYTGSVRMIAGPDLAYRYCNRLHIELFGNTRGMRRRGSIADASREPASIKRCVVVSSFCNRCSGMHPYTPACSPTIFLMCPISEMGLGWAASQGGPPPPREIQKSMLFSWPSHGRIRSQL